MPGENVFDRILKAMLEALTAVMEAPPEELDQEIETLEQVLAHRTGKSVEAIRAEFAAEREGFIRRISN